MLRERTIAHFVARWISRTKVPSLVIEYSERTLSGAGLIVHILTFLLALVIKVTPCT